MNKKSTFTFLIFILSVFVFSEKPLAVLTGLMKPTQLIISQNNIYVMESHKIHIYNRQTFKHKKTFGKIGGGPKEFPFKIRVHFFNKKLFVLASNKLLFYSEEGNYIKEEKIDRSSMVIFPITDGYFKEDFAFAVHKNKRFITSKVGLFDNQHNFKKKIFIDNEPSKFMEGGTTIAIDKKNLIIGNSRKNGSIMVFNHKGKLINTIKNKYPEDTVITDEFKKKYKESLYRGAGKYKNAIKQLKYNFPKFFASFHRVFSEEKMIYVFLPTSEFSRSIICAMTKDGTIKKKTEVKDGKCSWIENGIYYYILENDDTEEWKILSKEIL